MRRIVLTGPESTGKTTLARQLAEHYQTLWVSEYARFYLSRLNRLYTVEDVLEIAKGQLQWEDTWAAQSEDLLFCDTDLLVAKIWLKFKYNIENQWIETQLKSRSYDLYLLCDIDLPWTDDPLRENPNLEDRQALFELYHAELEVLGANFIVLKGDMQTRFQQAKVAVERLMRIENT